jgi:hypothetical protein
VEAGCRFIDAALLEKGVRLGCVSVQETNSGAEKNRKYEASKRPLCRDKHD